MNEYINRKEILLSDINIWTSTLYAVIQSFAISKAINFGRIDDIHNNLINSKEWIEIDCSYNSTLKNYVVENNNHVKFRHDPISIFPDIVKNIIKILIQDLVVIFDRQMDFYIDVNSKNAGNLPGEKIEYLKKYIKKPHEWSYFGCLELIECRNVFVHCGGHWSERSVARVAPFLENPPSNGDKLVLGIPMLFRFRKAVRTFISQLDKELRPKDKIENIRKNKSRISRRKSRHQIKMQNYAERKKLYK